MKILDISFWPKSKIFQHFSDFQYFTLSSKNSHKLGLTPPTDMVHHSIESWEPGEENGTWAGGLRGLQRSKKCWETEAIMFYVRQCRMHSEPEPGQRTGMGQICVLTNTCCQGFEYIKLASTKHHQKQQPQHQWKIASKFIKVEFVI